MEGLNELERVIRHAVTAGKLRVASRELGGLRGFDTLAAAYSQRVVDGLDRLDLGADQCATQGRNNTHG